MMFSVTKANKDHHTICVIHWMEGINSYYLPLQKIAQLTEVLEARESKVLELSQVNAALQDTNLRLKA